VAVAYIGLGSNVGDRIGHLEEAIRRIGNLPDTEVESVSSAYDTAPIGRTDQPRFLNAVVRVRTGLSPRELLGELLRIERELGRERKERWGPRTVDLDLLLYDDRVISEPGLQVPHPRLHERAFVLVPLEELDPRLVHPVLGKTVRELSEEVRGQDVMKVGRIGDRKAKGHLEKSKGGRCRR